CKWKTDAGAWKCKYPQMRGVKIVGGLLGHKNTLYFHAPQNKKEWRGPFPTGTRALKGHYWICGSKAYWWLHQDWSGVCYVGYVRPLFFLLSQTQGAKLGIKLYDELQRMKWSVNASIDASLAGGSTQKWGPNEWPPERIIRYYGPATWNPNEIISGAREPIYNLNRIIRLQAVLEIVTNQMATALDLLVDQATQMRSAILQHRMVLDYLLVEEGGVCGKLNESNCCLQIDDNGKVVKQITKQIRKIAHVLVQTWKSMDWDLLSWLPGGLWIKRILFIFLCIVFSLLFVPCMIPFFAILIRRIINKTQFVMTPIEKRNNVQVLVLKKWTLQNEDDEIQLVLDKIGKRHKSR
ncbi:ENR1 protein, partial [Baryphthengus martii]|nr:ENR1 protein [Baryphthengus martii]